MFANEINQLSNQISKKNYRYQLDNSCLQGKIMLHTAACHNQLVKIYCCKYQTDNLREQHCLQSTGLSIFNGTFNIQYIFVPFGL